MTTEKEYNDLIERMNKERFELLASKQYLYGRKVLNIIGAFRQHKIKSLIAAWTQGYKVRRTYCIRTKSDYNYGDYPDRKLRFCVYTCITGDYDNLQQIHVRPDNVDYIAYTDNINIQSSDWIIKPLPKELKKIKSNADRNRYLKMHPTLVGDYDYAMYIDGLVEVYSDVTNMINVLSPKYGIAIHNHFYRNCIFEEVKFCHYHQLGNYTMMKRLIKRYEVEKFPKLYGLLECTVILTDLHNKTGLNILDIWWQEHIKQETGRDQLTLPYILWKNGISVDKIGTLGNNVKTNQKFRVNSHSEKLLQATSRVK